MTFKVSIFEKSLCYWVTNIYTVITCVWQLCECCELVLHDNNFNFGRLTSAINYSRHVYVFSVQPTETAQGLVENYKIPKTQSDDVKMQSAKECWCKHVLTNTFITKEMFRITYVSTRSSIRLYYIQYRLSDYLAFFPKSMNFNSNTRLLQPIDEITSIPLISNGLVPKNFPDFDQTRTNLAKGVC